MTLTDPVSRLDNLHAEIKAAYARGLDMSDPERFEQMCQAYWLLRRECNDLGLI
jgi:hypothetical protein